MQAVAVQPMLKVSNRKVLLRLSMRNLAAARSRNLIAVSAIILTSVLFTVLFTLALGTAETFQRQTIRQSGGDGHAVLKYITDEQYQSVKDHPLIREISYNRIVADSVDNQEFLKRHVEMYYMDETAMKLGFCAPAYGSSPQAAYEVAADTKTLDLLGVPHQIGAKLPLVYTVKGKEIRQTFTLSGYWDSDPLFNVGFVLVSKAYVEEHAAELTPEYRQTRVSTGSINSYIMFKNSWNLHGKLDKVMVDSGLSRDNEEAPNYTASNVNWAYLSSGISDDPASWAGGAAALLLVMLTGYLIIYNIFYISVIRDIRFYGLIKTIGATRRQMKGIIRSQALALSALGIPAGLLLGFFIGKSLVPAVIAVSSYDESAGVTVSPQPLLFAASALFALATVWISTSKPGRAAAGVSPVEAVKASEESRQPGGKRKGGLRGGKIRRLALSNLGRNKVRTVLVILSMSLSLILLNTVFTLSRGLDMDKYLSKFVDSDYLIGHANYFNQTHFTKPEDALSKSFITAVSRQPGFERGGRLYYNLFVGLCSIDYPLGEPVTFQGIANVRVLNGWPVNLAGDGKPQLDLYGLEDFPLSRLEIVEGERDMETLRRMLATGQYIIEGLNTDDYEQVEAKASHFAIGDTITIHVDGKTRSYELLAKAKQKHYTNTNRTRNTFAMYLPADEYLKIVTRPLAMTYAFNVQDEAESGMERFVADYTRETEPMMNYESKQTAMKELSGLNAMVLLVGGALSLIIGMVGLLNFINSILTGILARKRELATMQSIGMTGSQLRRMLTLEGLYYGAGTALISLAGAALFSLTAVRGVAGSLWFFSYHFVLWPLAAAIPPLFVLALLIPYAFSRLVTRQSVVERLREAE